MRRLALPFLLFPLGLAGCHPGYSPNTYASNAAQVEANVQRGVIIGVRQVLISASGTIGAATGGAAGGVAGAQISGSPVTTAFGAIGGTLIGGVGGAAAAQALADTKGWEYIVQETGDKLVSVTQTSKTALPIGQHVLVISDTQQARIVPDYTVETTPAAKPVAPASDSTATEINLSPFSPPIDTADPLPIDPANAAIDPASPPVPVQAVPSSAALPVPGPPSSATGTGTTGTASSAPANP